MTKKLGDQHYTRPLSGTNKRKEDRSWVVVLGQYMGITTQNSAVIALFGLVGWYLDKRFNTKPYLLIIGIFVGVVVSFYLFIQSIQALQNNAKK